MKKVLSIILTVVMLLGTLSTLSAIPAFAEVTGAEVSDGEGKEADKPAGNGTKDDPYLIATLANLNWLKAGIKNADDNGTYGKNVNGVTASFDGVYFKQTADIDLGGKNFGAIGGYICEPHLAPDPDSKNDYLYLAAFGGEYDGNGYSIKNGTVIPYGQNKTNINWTSGFFGIIYGGTVKNMVFDNVTFKHSTRLNGNVVGIAHAPIAETVGVNSGSPANPDAEYIGDPTFNVIENCVVKSNCKSIVTNTYNPENEATKISIQGWTYGITSGGIVGRAIATTIRGCVSQAPMTVPAGTVLAGGIVGYAGNGVIIEDCVNTSHITFDGDMSAELSAWPNYVDIAIGGIIGSIFAASNGTDAQLYTVKSGVAIRNCVNAGKLTVAAGSVIGDVDSTHGMSLQWGGIIGGTNNLYIIPDVEKAYIIENCYNLTPTTVAAITAPATDTEPVVSFTNNASFRVGGILASGYVAANSNHDTLYIKDCYSVDGERAYGNGTNEVSIHGNKITSGKGSGRAITLLGVNAILADGSAYAVDQKTDKTYATIGSASDFIYEYDEGTATYVKSTTKTFNTVIDEITGVAAKADAVSDHSKAELEAKPEGSGTKADPYIIDSYEDLLWISKGVKDGYDNSQYGLLAYNGVSASYQNTYFEQTADIDLNGETVFSIGGYYKNTAVHSDSDKCAGKEYMSAFGGTYNGNGYKIYNGTIEDDPAIGVGSRHWAAGLFGALYGGTVKNLTLSNITYAYNPALVTGGLVGQTMSKSNANGDPTFNLIENCKVTGSTIAPEHGMASGHIDFKLGGVVGGIVGLAASATIKNCVNEATIESERGINSTGGIVGQVTSSVIDHCVNKGAIIIVADENGFEYTNDGDEIGYGGIAGTIASGALKIATADLDNGGLLISNCFNVGDIIDKYNLVQRTSKGHKIHMGGILGGLNTPTYIAETEANPYPYYIVNSYNLNEFTAKPDTTKYPGAIQLTNRNELRMGGILGSAWSSNNTVFSPVYVEDCYSVNIAQGHYRGTNEIRLQLGANAEGKRYAIGLGANATGLVNESNAGTTYANFDATVTAAANTLIKSDATKDADYIKTNFTNAIDTAITKAHKDAVIMNQVGLQTAEDGDSKYRVVLGVDAIAVYEYLGVKMTFTNSEDKVGTAEKTSKYLYTSVIAGDDIATAEAYGCSFLNLLTIDITGMEDGVYDIMPYVVMNDGENVEENRVYGDTIYMTVADGAATFSMSK